MTRFRVTHFIIHKWVRVEMMGFLHLQFLSLFLLFTFLSFRLSSNYLDPLFIPVTFCYITSTLGIPGISRSSV